MNHNYLNIRNLKRQALIAERPFDIDIIYDGIPAVITVNGWFDQTTVSRGITTCMDYSIKGVPHFQIEEIGGYFRDEKSRLIRVTSIAGSPIPASNDNKQSDLLILDHEWDALRFEAECRALMDNMELPVYPGLKMWQLIEKNQIHSIQHSLPIVGHATTWRLNFQDTNRYLIVAIEAPSGDIIAIKDSSNLN